MKRILLVLLLFTIPALANPSTAGVTAFTKGDTVRLVMFEVMVHNRGKEVSPPSSLLVTCTPRVSKDQAKPGTIKGENILKTPIPAMEPGERKKVTVESPYTSRNSFRGQRSTFRAFNVDPTREVTVQFKASIKAAQR